MSADPRHRRMEHIYTRFNKTVPGRDNVTVTTQPTPLRSLNNNILFATSNLTELDNDTTETFYEEFGIESPPSPVSSHTISIESQELDSLPGNRSILLNCGSTLALRNEFSGFAFHREFTSDFLGEGSDLLKEKNQRSYRDTGRRIKIYRRVFEEKREPGLTDFTINKGMTKYNSMVHASFWRTTIGKWKHIATLSDATNFNDLGHDLLMSTQYMGVGHFSFRRCNLLCQCRDD